jgi:NAD(P)-dependent dehydrogenase (short-subunit alcohol dehydrogenase family)
MFIKKLLPEELYFMVNGFEKQKTSDVNMQGKTVVISGSSSGVGLEALKQFAAKNANIVMVVRNLEKSTIIKNQILDEFKCNIDIIIADFSDFDSVKKAANEILQNYKTIDVLINSVGIHSTKKRLNKDGFEMGFVVNHLSVFLFTQLLLDRLKESSPSRIIQVNSEGHRFNGLKINDVNFEKRIYTGLRSYGQSKVAQLYTMYEMSKRLEGTGVTINAMHPGAVKSHIGYNNGFLYRFYAKYILKHFLKNPVISGKAIFYLATSKEMENVSGNFYNLTIKEKPAWHAVKINKKGMPIWNLSMKMTGLE